MLALETAETTPTLDLGRADWWADAACNDLTGMPSQLFFSDELPNPTYGKGGILWASLTLALLTLPVVIVATEEALAAVPNSMREGSYACGASKWQTIRRILTIVNMKTISSGSVSEFSWKMWPNLPSKFSY